MREHPDVIELSLKGGIGGDKPPKRGGGLGDHRNPEKPRPPPRTWEEDEQRDKRDEHGGMICSECGRRGPAGSLCYPMLIQ